MLCVSEALLHPVRDGQSQASHTHRHWVLAERPSLLSPDTLAPADGRKRDVCRLKKEQKSRAEDGVVAALVKISFAMMQHHAQKPLGDKGFI